MKKSDLLNKDYNYYPKTMIALDGAAYLENSQDIDAAVAKLGLQVVWGPAKLVDWIGISYSLMYVACNTQTEEYTVVIRGTNPISLVSWLKEDFDIDYTQPFTDFVPSAPAGAVLSQSSYNGLNDLISLKDPVTGLHLVNFLQSASPKYLYMTGHSLGGTLTPPMFAYLNYILYGGDRVHNMACWSFAGLTSGNNDFAQYWNSLSNQDFSWRIHNPLDIAPFLFFSEADVQSIYSTYGLPWSSLNLIIRGIIDGLFLMAAGKNYTQPLGDQQLAVAFNSNLKVWDDQAFYQHHVTTYITLVNQFYGS